MIPPATLPPSAAAPTSSAAPGTASVRMDAYQAGQRQPGHDMGQAFNHAVDGFSARANDMQARVRDIASPGRAPGQVPAAGEAQSLVAKPPVATPAVDAAPTPMQGQMALMMDCFNFAIETSLVSRAATQFTGAVSTLMKGQ